MSKVTEILSDLKNIETLTGDAQTQLESKVDDSQVLTNVPAGAVFTDTIYTHPTTDGNLHVPATSTTNNGKVLKAGATAGSIAWGTLTASDVGAAATSHTHAIADVTNLQTTLDAKASTAVATTSVNGLMSSTDKTKLDGVAANANNYVHPTTDGNLHVPATGTTNAGKVLTAGATEGSLSWETPTTGTSGISSFASIWKFS